MPTYEYRCPTCGAEQAATMTIAEYSEAQSPVCMDDAHPYNGVPMTRIYTAPRHFTIEGLHPDRFKVADQVARNRQTAHDKGEL